jgi:ribosomal RNA-processing protein 36
MPSTKRKILDAGLQRRVKVRRESSEDVESAGLEPSLDNGDIPSSDDGDSDFRESEGEVCTIRSSFGPSLTMFSV